MSVTQHCLSDHSFTSEVSRGWFLHVLVTSWLFELNLLVAFYPTLLYTIYIFARFAMHLNGNALTGRWKPQLWSKKVILQNTGQKKSSSKNESQWFRFYTQFVLYYQSGQTDDDLVTMTFFDDTNVRVWALLIAIIHVVFSHTILGTRTTSLTLNIAAFQSELFSKLIWKL